MSHRSQNTQVLFVRAVRVVVIAALVAVVVSVGMPAASAQPLTAETYWVDAINGLNTNPGTEALPFATITYAASISDSLDTIMVEPGTYDGAINELFPISFNGQSLKSTGGATVTTIQGNGVQQLLSLVAWDDGDSLEGFTIRDGGSYASAAVVVNVSEPTDAATAPTIADCTFTSNDGGSLSGGALYVSAGVGTNLRIVRNTFTDNTATYGGGAIGAREYGALYVGDNVFSTNIAMTDGAALNLYTGSGAYAVVEHNVMRNNSSMSSGGAIYWEGGTPTAHLLRGNTIYANTARYGGALYLHGVTLDIEANECRANVAGGAGWSGLAYLEGSTVSAKSNYLAQNSASNGGAVWTVDLASTLAEVNDTVVGNSGGQWATYAYPGSILTIVNCTYANGGIPGTIYEVANADDIRYSFSRDDLATLTGATHDNLVGAGMVYGTDPGFDSTLGAPYLAETSPCVDTGDPSTYAVTDLYDTVRPVDGDDNGSALPDIGCYELSQATLVPVYRFYNFVNSTHFFTDSAAEADMVIATWPNVYRYEGICYYTNPANNTQPLYRFYNKVSSSHFYTASAGEAAHILATWPHIFVLDGQTYAVNPGPVANSLPVYRFYNVRNGSHFYTASETEKAHVLATWPGVYTYEGPAFWIGQ